MVAAAGNSGPTCGSVTDPPAIYEDVYTAGALNNGTDTAATFSSRGPVGTDGSFRLKPDLSAPGTNVRSSLNTSNTTYGKLSGTSMATPHIAGAVALLWSAVPLLKNDVARTEQLLNQSAVPIGSTDGCGGAIPNDTYGNGRLDVKAAVDYGRLETTPVTIVRNANGSDTFTFYAGAGRTYRLERRFDFNDTGWYQAAGVDDFTVTTDGPAQVTDPNAGSYVDQFYRVRVLP
jgi:subtilisin family serine protease